MKSKIISWLGLFTSMGTLLCCALPSLLVVLGFGAAFASVLGEVPFLITLSENKEYVFGISFVMLALSFWAQRWSQNQTCPVDKREDCEQTKDWSKPLLWASLVINIIGFSYAFLIPALM